MSNKLEVVTAAGKTLLLELGNVHDNESVFRQAQHQIELGDEHAAAAILIALTTHIVRTGEPKSRARLLDEIYAALSKLGVDAQYLPLTCWIIGHKPMKRNGIHALLESAHEPDEPPPFDVVMCQRCRTIYCLDAHYKTQE